VKDAAGIYMWSGLIMRACRSAFWPLLFVRLVTEVDLSPLQLVLLGTVFELTILVSEIPTGIVADIYSRRLSVILTFLIGGVAMFMSALVSPYWLLVISQMLVGFASTFETGAETAWITDELGSAEEAEHLILRRGQYQLFAGVVGVIGFSLLAWGTTLSTALAATGVTYVLWGLVLLAVMPENNFTRTEGEGWAEFAGMLRGGFAETRGVAALRILVTVIFIGGLAKEAIDRLDVKRLVDVGLPEDTNEAVIIGVIVAAKMLLAIGFVKVARTRARGRSVVPAMTMLLVGIGVGVLVLAHVDLLAIAALGLMFQGGFHFATEPLVTTWTNTFASSKARATIHSFVGQAEAFGEIIGGIVLGTVAEVFTVPTAMTISAVLFFLAAGLAITTRRVWDSSLSQVHAP